MKLLSLLLLGTTGVATAVEAQSGVPNPGDLGFNPGYWLSLQVCENAPEVSATCDKTRAKTKSQSEWSEKCRMTAMEATGASSPSQYLAPGTEEDAWQAVMPLRQRCPITCASCDTNSILNLGENKFEEYRDDYDYSIVDEIFGTCNGDLKCEVELAHKMCTPIPVIRRNCQVMRQTKEVNQLCLLVWPNTYYSMITSPSIKDYLTALDPETLAKFSDLVSLDGCVKGCVDCEPLTLEELLELWIEVGLRPEDFPGYEYIKGHDDALTSGNYETGILDSLIREKGPLKTNGGDTIIIGPFEITPNGVVSIPGLASNGQNRPFQAENATGVLVDGREVQLPGSSELVDASKEGLLEEARSAVNILRNSTSYFPSPIVAQDPSVIMRPGRDGSYASFLFEQGFDIGLTEPNVMLNALMLKAFSLGLPRWMYEAEVIFSSNEAELLPVAERLAVFQSVKASLNKDMSPGELDVVRETVDQEIKARLANNQNKRKGFVPITSFGAFGPRGTYGVGGALNGNEIAGRSDFLTGSWTASPSEKLLNVYEELLDDLWSDYSAVKMPSFFLQLGFFDSSGRPLNRTAIEEPFYAALGYLSTYNAKQKVRLCENDPRFALPCGYLQGRVASAENSLEVRQEMCSLTIEELVHATELVVNMEEAGVSAPKDYPRSLPAGVACRAQCGYGCDPYNSLAVMLELSDNSVLRDHEKTVMLASEEAKKALDIEDMTDNEIIVTDINAILNGTQVLPLEFTPRVISKIGCVDADKSFCERMTALSEDAMNHLCSEETTMLTVEQALDVDIPDVLNHAAFMDYCPSLCICVSTDAELIAPVEAPFYLTSQTLQTFKAPSTFTLQHEQTRDTKSYSKVSAADEVELVLLDRANVQTQFHLNVKPGPGQPFELSIANDEDVVKLAYNYGKDRLPPGLVLSPQSAVVIGSQDMLNHTFSFVNVTNGSSGDKTNVGRVDKLIEYSKQVITSLHPVTDVALIYFPREKEAAQVSNPKEAEAIFNPGEFKQLLPLPEYRMAKGSMTGSDALRFNDEFWLARGAAIDAWSMLPSVDVPYENKTHYDELKAQGYNMTDYNATQVVQTKSIEVYHVYLAPGKQIPAGANLVPNSQMFYVRSRSEVQAMLSDIVAEVKEVEVAHAGLPLIIQHMSPLIRKIPAADFDPVAYMKAKNSGQLTMEDRKKAGYATAVGLPFSGITVYSHQRDPTQPMVVVKEAVVQEDAKGLLEYVRDTVGLSSEAMDAKKKAELAIQQALLVKSYQVNVLLKETLSPAGVIDLLGPSDLHIDAIVRTFKTPVAGARPGNCVDALGAYCAIVRVNRNICGAPVSDFIRSMFNMHETANYADMCASACGECTWSAEDFPMLSAVLATDIEHQAPAASTRFIVFNSTVLSTVGRPLGFLPHALELSEMKLEVSAALDLNDVVKAPSALRLTHFSGDIWALPIPERASHDGRDGVWLVQNSRRLIGPFELRMSPTLGCMFLVDKGQPVVYPSHFQTNASGRVVWMSHRGYLPGVRQGEIVFPVIQSVSDQVGLGIAASSGDVVWKARTVLPTKAFISPGTFMMPEYVTIDRYAPLSFDWQVKDESDRNLIDTDTPETIGREDPTAVVKVFRSLHFTLPVPNGKPLALRMQAKEVAGRFILNAYYEGSSAVIPIATTDGQGAWFMDNASEGGVQATTTQPSPRNRDLQGLPGIALLPDGALAIVVTQAVIENMETVLRSRIVWATSDVPAVLATSPVLRVGASDGRARLSMIVRPRSGEADAYTQESVVLFNSNATLAVAPPPTVWSSISDSTEALLRAVDKQATGPALADLMAQGEVSSIPHSSLKGWRPSYNAYTTIAIAGEEGYLHYDKSLSTALGVAWSPSASCAKDQKDCTRRSPSSLSRPVTLSTMRGVPVLTSSNNLVVQSSRPIMVNAEDCDPSTDRLVLLPDGNLAVVCHSGDEVTNFNPTRPSWVAKPNEPLAELDALIKVGVISFRGRSAIAVIDVHASEILWMSDARDDEYAGWGLEVFTFKTGMVASNGVIWTTVFTSDSAPIALPDKEHTVGFGKNAQHVELWHTASGSLEWSSRNDVGSHQTPSVAVNFSSRRSFKIGSDGRLAITLAPTSGADVKRVRSTAIWMSVSHAETAPIAQWDLLKDFIDTYHLHLAVSQARDGRHGLTMWATEGAVDTNLRDAEINVPVIKPDGTTVFVKRKRYSRRGWRSVAVGHYGGIRGTPYFEATAASVLGAVVKKVTRVKRVSIESGSFAVAVNEAKGYLELRTDADVTIWSNEKSSGWLVNATDFSAREHTYDLRLLADGNLAVFATRTTTSENSQAPPKETLIWTTGFSVVDPTEVSSVRLAVKVTPGLATLLVLKDGVEVVWKSGGVKCSSLKCIQAHTYLADEHKDFKPDALPLSDYLPKRLLYGRSTLYLGESGFALRLRDDGLLEGIEVATGRIIWTSDVVGRHADAAPYSLEVSSDGRLSIFDAERRVTTHLGRALDGKVHRQAYLGIETSPSGEARLISVGPSGATLWATNWQSMNVIARVPDVVWTVKSPKIEETITLANTRLLLSHGETLEPTTKFGQLAADVFYTIVNGAVVLKDGRTGNVLWSSTSTRSGGVTVVSSAGTPNSSTYVTLRQTDDGRLVVFQKENLVWISGRESLIAPRPPAHMPQRTAAHLALGISVGYDGAVAPAVCASFPVSYGDSFTIGDVPVGKAVWTAQPTRAVYVSSDGCHSMRLGVQALNVWTSPQLSQLQSDLMVTASRKARTFVLSDGFSKATAGGSFMLTMSDSQLSLTTLSGSVTWSSSLPTSGGLRAPVASGTKYESGKNDCQVVFLLSGHVSILCGTDRHAVWSSQAGFALPSNGFLTFCVVEGRATAARLAICDAQRSVVWVGGAAARNEPTLIPADSVLEMASVYSSVDVETQQPYNPKTAGVVIATLSSSATIFSSIRPAYTANLGISKSQSSIYLERVTDNERLWSAPLISPGKTTTVSAEELPDSLQIRIYPDGKLAVVDSAGRIFFSASAGRRTIGDAVCAAFSTSATGQVQFALASPSGSQVFWRGGRPRREDIARLAIEEADLIVSSNLCARVTVNNPLYVPEDKLASLRFAEESFTVSSAGAMEVRDQNSKLLWSSHGFDSPDGSGATISTLRATPYLQVANQGVYLSELQDGNLGVVQDGTNEVLWRTTRISASSLPTSGAVEVGILRHKVTKKFIAPVLVEKDPETLQTVVVWKGAPWQDPVECEEEFLAAWSVPELASGKIFEMLPSLAVKQASNFTVAVGTDGVLRLIDKHTKGPVWESHTPNFMSGLSKFALALDADGVLSVVAPDVKVGTHPVVIWRASHTPFVAPRSLGFRLKACVDSSSNVRPIIETNEGEMIFIGAPTPVARSAETATLYARESVPSATVAERPEYYSDPLEPIESEEKRNEYGELLAKYILTTSATDCSFEVLDTFNGNSKIWSSSGFYNSVTDGNGGIVIKDVNRTVEAYEVSKWLGLWKETHIDPQVRCRIDQLVSGQLTVSTYYQNVLDTKTNMPYLDPVWTTGFDTLCYNCNISVAISERPGRRPAPILLLNYLNGTQVAAWRGVRISTDAELVLDPENGMTEEAIRKAVIARFGALPAGADLLDEDKIPSGTFSDLFPDEKVIKTHLQIHIPKQPLDSIIGRPTLRSGDATLTKAGLLRLTDTGVLELRDEHTGVLRWISHEEANPAEAARSSYELRLLIDGNVAIVGQLKTLYQEGMNVIEDEKGEKDHSQLEASKKNQLFVRWVTSTWPLKYSNHIRFVFEESTVNGGVRAVIRGDGDIVLWSSVWQSHGAKELRIAGVPAVTPISISNKWGIRTVLSTAANNLPPSTGLTISVTPTGDIQLVDASTGDVHWSSLTWGHTKAMPAEGTFVIRQAANGHLATVSVGNGHIRWTSGTQPLMHGGAAMPIPVVLRSRKEFKVQLAVIDPSTYTPLWPAGLTYNENTHEMYRLVVQEDETVVETFALATVANDASTIPVPGTPLVFSPTNFGGLALIDKTKGSKPVWISNGQPLSTSADGRAYRLARVRSGETGVEYTRGDGIKMAFVSDRDGGSIVRLTTSNLIVQSRATTIADASSLLGVSVVVEVVFQDPLSLNKLVISSTGSILGGNWVVQTYQPATKPVHAPDYKLIRGDGRIEVYIEGSTGLMKLTEHLVGGCTVNTILPDDMTVPSGTATLRSLTSTGLGAEVKGLDRQVSSTCVRAPMEILTPSFSRWEQDGCDLIRGVARCSGVNFRGKRSDTLSKYEDDFGLNTSPTSYYGTLYSTYSSQQEDLWERKASALDKYQRYQEFSQAIRNGTNVTAAFGKDFDAELFESGGGAHYYAVRNSGVVVDPEIINSTESSKLQPYEGLTWKAPTSGQSDYGFSIRQLTNGNIIVVERHSGLITWASSLRSVASSATDSPAVQLAVQATPLGTATPVLVSTTDGSVLWSGAPAETRVMPASSASGLSDGAEWDSASLDVPNLSLRFKTTSLGELQVVRESSNEVIWSAYGPAAQNGLPGSSGNGGVWLKQPKASDGPFMLRFQPDGNMAVIAKGTTPDSVVWVTSQIPQPSDIGVELVLQRDSVSGTVRPAIVRLGTNQALWAGGNFTSYSIPFSSTASSVMKNSSRSYAIWQRTTQRTGTPDLESNNGISVDGKVTNAPGLSCSLASLDTGKYVIKESRTSTIVVECQRGFEPSGLPGHQWSEELSCNASSGILHLPTLKCLVPERDKCSHPVSSLKSSYIPVLATWVTTPSTEYDDHEFDNSVEVICAEGFVASEIKGSGLQALLGVTSGEKLTSKADGKLAETIYCKKGRWQAPKALDCQAACPAFEEDGRFVRSMGGLTGSGTQMLEYAKADIVATNRLIKANSHAKASMNVQCAKGFISRKLVDYRRMLRSSVATPQMAAAAAMRSNSPEMVEGRAFCLAGRWVSEMDCIGTGRFGISLGGAASAVSDVGAVVPTTESSQNVGAASALSTWSASLVPYAEAGLHARGDAVGRAAIFKSTLRQRMQQNVPYIVQPKASSPVTPYQFNSSETHQGLFDLEGLMMEVDVPNSRLHVSDKFSSSGDSLASGSVTSNANAAGISGSNYVQAAAALESILATRRRTLDVGCFVSDSGSQIAAAASAAMANRTGLSSQFNLPMLGDASSRGVDGHGKVTTDCFDGTIASIAVYRRTARTPEIAAKAKITGQSLPVTLINDIALKARKLVAQGPGPANSKVTTPLDVIKSREGGSELLQLVQQAQDAFGLVGFYIAIPELLTVSVTASSSEEQRLHVAQWKNLLSLLTPLAVEPWVGDLPAGQGGNVLAYDSAVAAAAARALAKPLPALVQKVEAYQPRFLAGTGVVFDGRASFLTTSEPATLLYTGLAFPLPQSAIASQTQNVIGKTSLTSGAVDNHKRIYSDGGVTIGVDFATDGPLGSAQTLFSERWGGCQQSQQDALVSAGADSTIIAKVLSSALGGAEGRIQVGIDVGEGSLMGSKASLREWRREICPKVDEDFKADNLMRVKRV